MEVGNQEVLSLSFDYDDKRVKRIRNLPKRYSSLISCCDYLVSKGYTHILLVANNRQTNQKAISSGFQRQNRLGINSLKDYAYIFKYSDEAVFDVSTRTVKEFLMMKDEDLILGTPEEKKENKLLKGLAFSDAYLYKVQTKGLNNASIESGCSLDAILPYAKKQEILNGAEKIEYNNLIIERITGVETKEEEKAPEKEETPDKNMTYPQMKKYVQDNNIKVKSMKKEDLIKAIWG